MMTPPKWRVLLFTLNLVSLSHIARANETNPGSLFAPELRDEELFTETFSAIGDLEGGTYVQLQIGVTNVGPGTAKGACRALVVFPDGDVWTASAKVDRDEWRFVATPTPSLRVGRCHLTDRGASIEIEVLAGGGKVRLKLEAAPLPIRPPGYRIETDDGFYSTEILVPWAPARADIRRPGHRWQRGIKGVGFADHSRSTVLPGDVADRWVRLRVLDGPHARLALGRFPPGSDAPVGWHWRRGQPGPVPLGTCRLRSVPSGSDGPPAWQVTLGPRSKSAAKSAGPEILRSGRLLYRHAPIEELGVLGAVLSTAIGNPVTYTYRVPGGLLEVTVVDE